MTVIDFEEHYKLPAIGNPDVNDRYPVPGSGSP